MRSFVSSQDRRKAIRPRSGSISCVQSSETLCFSRLCPWHNKVARKRAKRMGPRVLKLGLQNQVRQITKRRCLHRRLTPRFHPQLPLPRTLRQFLRRNCLRRVVAAPARLQPRADQPLLTTSPPYRSLESLTCGTILPDFEWLPWLSRRASQAVLFARRSSHRSPDF